MQALTHIPTYIPVHELSIKGKAFLYGCMGAKAILAMSLAYSITRRLFNISSVQQKKNIQKINSHYSGLIAASIVGIALLIFDIKKNRLLHASQFYWYEGCPSDIRAFPEQFS